MLKKTLVLGVLLAACGKDPLAGVADAMRRGDRAGAQALIEEAKARRPESEAAHYQALLLYRLLAAQGDPARQASYEAAVLDEYRWIIAKSGAEANFTDIEGSLKSSPKTQDAYAAAHAAIYPR